MAKSIERGGILLTAQGGKILSAGPAHNYIIFGQLPFPP